MKKTMIATFSAMFLALACAGVYADEHKHHQEGKTHKECPHAKKKNCTKTCPEHLKAVKTETKNLENGIEIQMTAADKETVERIQELALVHYNAKESMCPDSPAKVDGAAISIVNVENGAIVTVTGENSETVKKIQDAATTGHKHMAKKGGHIGCQCPECKKKASDDKKEAKKSIKYVCPMGCAESDKPGKCPKCKMEMVKKKS